MNKKKFGEKELNQMLKSSGKSAGVDAASLKAAAESGKLNEYLGKKLSPEAQQKVQSVLSDKKALQKLLSGKEAQELLKKLGKE